MQFVTALGPARVPPVRVAAGTPCSARIAGVPGANAAGAPLDEDVDTQLAGASRALDRAGFAIIVTGLQQCLTDADGNGSDGETTERMKGHLEELFPSLDWPAGPGAGTPRRPARTRATVSRA